MHLNATKCYRTKLTRKSNNNKIKDVDTTKGLGVLLTKIFVNKSSKMLGFIIRNSKEFWLHKTKILLYNALIRGIVFSHLTFNRIKMDT